MVDFSNDFISYPNFSHKPLLTPHSFKCMSAPYLITLDTCQAPIYSLNRIYSSVCGNQLVINIHYATNDLSHSVHSIIVSVLIDTLFPNTASIHMLDIFAYLLDPRHIYCHFLCIAILDPH